MTSDFFTGSKLKIKRADKHIKELNLMVRSFRKKGGHRTEMKLNRQTGEQIIRYASFESKEAFDEIAPVIGDIVHNLRAALDLVAYDLVRWSGKTPDPFTKFPFRESRKEVIDAINGGAIPGLPLNLQTLFIDVIQPYKTGNDPLCALHDLDITDKHHTLIPI